MTAYILCVLAGACIGVLASAYYFATHQTRLRRRRTRSALRDLDETELRLRRSMIEKAR